MTAVDWRSRLIIRQARAGDTGTYFDPEYGGADAWYAFHVYGSPGKAFAGPFATYSDALDTLDRLSDEVAAEWFDMDNVRLSDALH